MGQSQHTPTPAEPLSGTDGKLNSAARSIESRCTDVVDLSDYARKLSSLQHDSSVRSELVERIRSEIVQGKYEIDDRLDMAVDGLIRDIDAVSIANQPSIRTELVQPVSLYFDLNEFSKEDVVAVIEGLSALYTSIGGDELVFEDAGMADPSLASASSGGES